MKTRCEGCHKHAIGGEIHLQSIIGFIVMIFSAWVLFFWGIPHVSIEVVNVPQLNANTGEYYNHYVEKMVFDWTLGTSALLFISMIGGAFVWFERWLTFDGLIQD